MSKASIPTRLVLAATACGLVAAAALPGLVAATPTLRSQSWYLRSLHLAAAQRLATGAGVTIAVVGTGINPATPELSGRVVAGYDPAGSAGRVDRVGTGTALASLAAGAGDGAGRVRGVAPGSAVMPVRLPPSRTDPVTPGELARAARWAIDHGARVVTIPFGPYDPRSSTSALRDLVTYAADHDAVLVAAAGDSAPGRTTIGAPARLPGVVAVTGLSVAGRAWAGALTGSAVVVSAPAEDIPYATGLRSAPYKQGNGTDLAAALVAGELALIMSSDASITAADAINQLIATANDLGVRGRDPVYGYGAANPLAALDRPVPHVAVNPLAAGAPTNASSSYASRSATGPLGMPTALLVGIVIGLVVLATLLIVFIVMLRARRRGGDGGGGGGGGGGPDGPRWPGPDDDPAGSRHPRPPADWQPPTTPGQHTRKQPVPVGAGR